MVVLHTKSVEDYIAKFSEHDTLQIVSIYQRRICDDEGNTDGGIIADINNEEKQNFKRKESRGANEDGRNHRQHAARRYRDR